jgi:uncharacterized membrane protein YecN with MAPEG domain
MPPALKITAIYAALNALLMLGLSINVVRNRLGTRTPILDGGKPPMIAAVRAHGNNIEYVPTALILLGLVEWLGGSPPLAHTIGGMLTAGRIAHAAALLRSTGPGALRGAGMFLTWGSMLTGILAIFRLALA